MRPLCLGLILTCVPAFAGTPTATPQDECCSEINLWTGEGVSIGNWFFPEFNYQVAAGSSTINPARLAVGHHDPDRYGITQQNIEVSATIRLGEKVSFFGTYGSKVDLNDHWASEFEEYYAIIDLPWDMRVRGGRLQPRVGYQNELHVHSFTFVDQYLVNARMFGEDALVINGGEVSMPLLRNLPTSWEDRLTVSFGAIPDPEEEEHEHFGPESTFESDGALLANKAFTANYLLSYNASDTTQYQVGVSGAFGDNEYGRTSQIYGMQFQYLWKPSGLAGHGHHHHQHDDHDHDGKGHAEPESLAFVQWRSEVFVRHFGAVSGHEEEEVEHAAEITVIPAQPEVRRQILERVGFREQGGSFRPVYRTRSIVVQEAQPERVVEEEHEAQHVDIGMSDEFTDWGFYSTVGYGFPNGKLQAHLRAEYVSGVSQAGLPERWRVSPLLTWYPTDRVPINFKLQYNYDYSPAFGDAHSVWVQLSLTWGDCCAH